MFKHTQGRTRTHTHAHIICLKISFTDIEAENNIEGRRTNQHGNYWTTETRGLYQFLDIFVNPNL